MFFGRFVYARYRQPPSGRMPYQHHQHQADEESIYESADHDRGLPCGDTPDSERYVGSIGSCCCFWLAFDLELRIFLAPYRETENFGGGVAVSLFEITAIDLYNRRK